MVLGLAVTLAGILTGMYWLFHQRRILRSRKKKLLWTIYAI